MPEALHKALAKVAKKKGFTGERFARYVYGGIKNWEKKQGKKKRVLAKPGN